MVHPPLLPYSGLSFILSNPSRLDTDKLISGTVATWFESCLRPITRYNCHIQTLESFNSGGRKLIPGTKVIVPLGSEAQRVFIPTLNLNETRGYVYKDSISNALVIPTYEPQDTLDRFNYDSDFDDEEDDKEEGKEKDHSPTKRKNYKFWFQNDIKKAVELTTSKVDYWTSKERTKFNLYLPSNEVIKLLLSVVDLNLYFDIETNANFNITVFSFSFDSSNIYCVPILRHDNTTAYGEVELCKIFRALALAFTRNTVIIHNSLFDLFILLWRYKILPPRKIYDTMVSWHRLNPEAEKSLGHVLSWAGHEEFHKHENIFEPKNWEQEQRLWMYNAKDVVSLAIIHPRLQEIAINNGLCLSLSRANSLVRPYLLQSFQGFNINVALKESLYEETEKLKIQYLRILKLLIGYDIIKLSPKRVAKYLYEFKRLPKPNPKYKDGKIEYEKLTASETLYKLLLKEEVPAIKVILAYRSKGKESGFLKFNLWRNRLTSGDKITGTDTFRLASSKLFGLWGTNKQNVTKRLRKICIADLGKIIVQTDQSGAEALVVAYLAPKGNYRLLFENGIKSHTFVAMHLFRGIWEAKLKCSIKHLIDSDIPSLKSKPLCKEVFQLIKDSDDWPAKTRYYYLAKMVCHACVTSEHEVLTKNGWKTIDTLIEGEAIATFSKQDQNIKFELPSKLNSYDFNGQLYKFLEPELSQVVTDTHKMLVWSNHKYRDMEAYRLAPYKGGRIPLAGNYVGGTTFVSTVDAKLIAAIQADGNIVNDRVVRFHFVKQRKIDRLKQLLIEGGYPFDIQQSPDYSTFISCPRFENLIKQFNGKKEFGPWLLDWNKEALNTLIEELKYWDGSLYQSTTNSTKRESYSSKIKANVEWIKTILHLCNKQGTISQGKDGIYILGINQRTMSRINGGKLTPYKGKVYCPTVNSGYFLVRHQGKISVTGNSNYGMKYRAFQLNVLKKSEGTIVLSKQEAEYFLSTYHNLFPEIKLWHIQVINQLVKDRTLYNLFGDRRVFYGQEDEQLYKQAFAFVPQSTVGVLTSEAIREIQEELDNGNEYYKETGLDLLANTHDAISSQCKIGYESRAAEIQEKHINKEFTTPNGSRFRMKSETLVGPNWYQLKALKV